MSDWTRDYFDRGYGQRWGLRAPNDQVQSEAAGTWTLLKLSSSCRARDLGRELDVPAQWIRADMRSLQASPC